MNSNFNREFSGSAYGRTDTYICVQVPQGKPVIEALREMPEDVCVVQKETDDIVEFKFSIYPLRNHDPEMAKRLEAKVQGLPYQPNRDMQFISVA